VSGVLSIILGIFFSLVFDLPSGATIVILNFLLFVCSFVYGRLLVK